MTIVYEMAWSLIEAPKQTTMLELLVGRVYVLSYNYKAFLRLKQHKKNPLVNLDYLDGREECVMGLGNCYVLMDRDWLFNPAYSDMFLFRLQMRTHYGIQILALAEEVS